MQSSSRHRIQQAGGFSLVEIMVAMALSLVLLAGVMSLFASSRRSYETNERLSRIQENGSFALDQIMRDIRSAGYLGCSHQSPFTNTLNNASTLLWNFAVPIEGFESTGVATWAPALDTTLLPSPSDASDVIAIRGANRDVEPQRLITALALPTANVAVTDVAPAIFSTTTNEIVMVSDCNGSAVFQIRNYSLGVMTHNAGGTNPGNQTNNLGYAFQDGADVYPVQTVIYYVRAGSIAGNGNSLWRRVGTGTPVEIAEGIDSLQFRYGIDANNDQVVENYLTADAVTDWSQLMSVSVGLLAHSLSEYGAENDAQAYTVLDATLGPYNDRRQRLVFATTATVRNRAL